MTPKKTLSNVSAALVLFLFLAVLTIVTNFWGLQGNKLLGWASYVIIIVGIIAVVIKYGKDRDNNVTFGNLFAYGFKTIAITTALFIVFSVLFYLIFPDYKAQILEIAHDSAMKNATPENREQVEKSLQMIDRFFWPGLIAGMMFMFAIVGAIGSVIGAAIAKKQPQPFGGDTN